MSVLGFVRGVTTDLVLFLYGLLIDHDSSANVVPVNQADNWLHFGLAIGMVGLGLLISRARTRAVTR